MTRSKLLGLLAVFLVLPLLGACEFDNLSGDKPQVSINPQQIAKAIVVNPGQEVEKILLLPFKDGLTPVQVGQCRESAFDSFGAVMRAPNFSEALKGYNSLPLEQKLDVQIRTTNDLVGRGRSVCIIDRPATPDDVQLKHVLGSLRDRMLVMPAQEARLEEMHIFSRLVSAEVLQRLNYEQAVQSFAKLDPSAQTRVTNRLTGDLSSHLIKR